MLHKRKGFFDGDFDVVDFFAEMVDAPVYMEREVFIDLAPPLEMNR